MASLSGRANRVLWVVRHGERADNVGTAWRRSSGLARDNTPMSERGVTQARECRARLLDEHIDHVFSSPYDRCVHTSQLIVEGRSLGINVEPGLCEVLLIALSSGSPFQALYLCEDPPGYESVRELKAKYECVDESYQAIVPRPPPESVGDDACIPRVRQTLDALLDRYPGSSPSSCVDIAGVLLLVGHGASIGAMHEVLVGRWKYVGQCTISKFVSGSDGKFKAEMSGDSSHLSDRTNLRAY